jgi:hypothetical protein
MISTVSYLENKDTIILGRDNSVVLVFTFDNSADPSFDLSDFTLVEVKFGEETYTIADTDVFSLVNNNTISLNLGATAETTSSYFEVIGTNGDYPNGYVITNRCLNNLTIPKLC